MHRRPADKSCRPPGWPSRRAEKTRTRCGGTSESGGLVEEFYDGQDLVLEAEHWIEGCPSLP